MIVSIKVINQNFVVKSTEDIISFVEFIKVSLNKLSKLIGIFSPALELDKT